MKLEKILDKKSLYITSHYGVILDGKLVVTNGHLAVVTPLESLIKGSDVNKLEGYLFYYDAVKLLSSKDSMKLKITDGCISLNGIEYKAVEKYNDKGEMKNYKPTLLYTHSIFHQYEPTVAIRKIILGEKGEEWSARALAGKILNQFEDAVDVKNSFTMIYNVKGREDKNQYFIEMSGDNTGTYGIIAGIEGL